MAIKFKPQQQAVIDCYGKNQLVSASAGSGKTTIMIQKIINLITQDKIDIGQILVLTYTKASAEEMKQKLVLAIYDAVKTNPELLGQLDAVSTADISTIHSFFQKVIKKNFMTLKINPSFEIIDETKGINLKNFAMEKAIENMEANNLDMLNCLLDAFDGERNINSLTGLVEQLNTFLLAVPNPKDWQSMVATSQYNIEPNNRALEILNTELFEGAQHFCQEFAKLQKITQNFDELSYVEVCNKYIGHLAVVKNDVQSFFQNLELWQNLPSVRVQTKQDVPELNAQLAKLNDSVKKFGNAICKWPIKTKQQYQQSLPIAKKLVCALCALTKEFQKQYALIKQQENVMDYDDLEKYMLKLIEDPAVCQAIKNQYQKIFVDEYQDANRVQETIISAICQDNNRFVVGDVKQSIYGFRQAEPDIFLETLANFSSSVKSEVGYLNYNFRSRPEILDFVNFVFGKIMTPRTCKIDYAATSVFRWDDGVYQNPQVQSLPAVEICIIQKPEKPQKPQPTKIYSVTDPQPTQKEYSVAQLEAFFVASKIAKILGTPIWLAKENRFKPIEYRDITILLKSRGAYLEEFCGVLTALDIPLFANTKAPLFADSDVKLLQNLLKIAVCPQNDVALVAVMHSLFGGFDFADLVAMRQANPKGTFFQCVKNFDGDMALQNKIQSFFAFLNDFAFDLNHLGAFAALSNTLSKVDFYTYILQKGDGFEKKEKVQKFLNDFITNDYNFDILGFLDFAEKNQDKINAPDFMGGDNCVSITTMHASKGLEYPIVIMANANQDFEKDPFASDIVLSQTLGMGVKLYNQTNRTFVPSLQFLAIKKDTKYNEFAEKLRLLYVAMTRPKNHLIVVGTAPATFVPLNTNFQVLRQKSYLSLLVGALDEEDIQKINEGQSVQNQRYSVTIINGQTQPNFMSNEQHIGGEFDQAAFLEMKNYFEFCPPQSAGKTKASVTALRELLQEGMQVQSSDDLAKPQNLQDVGTMYHQALQQIDFENTHSVQDVQKFLQQFKANNDVLCAEKIWQAILAVKQFEAKTYHKEIPFVMKINGQDISDALPNQALVVRGVIDLLCVGKKNVIVDYKYTKEKNLEKIKEKYKPQLKLYKLACQNYGVSVDECYLFLLDSGEILQVE